MSGATSAGTDTDAGSDASVEHAMTLVGDRAATRRPVREALLISLLFAVFVVGGELVAPGGGYVFGLLTAAGILTITLAIRHVMRRLLGIGFLATVRADGGPRVHPVCPVLTDDALFAFIVPGPKLNDLRRDGRYALHSETSPPPRHDDAFYVSGRAVEITDAPTWDRIATQLLRELGRAERWPGFEEQVLFELLLDRCLVTLTAPDDELPAGHTIWRP